MAEFYLNTLVNWILGNRLWHFCNLNFKSVYNNVVLVSPIYWYEEYCWKFQSQKNRKNSSNFSFDCLPMKFGHQEVVIYEKLLGNSKMYFRLTYILSRAFKKVEILPSHTAKFNHSHLLLYLFRLSKHFDDICFSKAYMLTGVWNESLK